MSRPGASETDPRSTTEPVIAALASPAGIGEIALVRVSGAGCHAIVRGLSGSPERASWPARLESTLLPILPEPPGVPALVVHYPEGRSYTGEESVEILLPGAPAFVRGLLARLEERGVSPAGPGEFTRRAFLAGRMDLTQAESVADLIAAEDRDSALAARRTLDGELGSAVHEIADSIHDWIALLEAGLDFADQEVEPPTPEEITGGLAPLEERLEEWGARSDAGSAPAAALRLLLWGRANAGKSTLLNALTGEERAIVSPTPGTTTDAVGGRLGRGADEVEILDLPGRLEEPSSIEASAERLAQGDLESTDRILYLLDASRPAEQLEEEWAELPAALRERAWPVFSQVDRLGPEARGALPRILEDPILCSAVTGEGIAELKGRIERFRRRGSYVSRGLARLFNDRQRRRLSECREQLDQVREQLDQSGTTEPELVVVDLRRAHESLEEITGEIAPEETLERIFSRFCVGK